MPYLLDANVFIQAKARMTTLGKVWVSRTPVAMSPTNSPPANPLDNEAASMSSPHHSSAHPPMSLEPPKADDPDQPPNRTRSPWDSDSVRWWRQPRSSASGP